MQNRLPENSNSTVLHRRSFLRISTSLLGSLALNDIQIRNLLAGEEPKFCDPDERNRQTRSFVEANPELRERFQQTVDMLQKEFGSFKERLQKEPALLGKGSPPEELEARFTDVSAKLDQLSKNIEPHLIAILGASRIDKYPAVQKRFMRQPELQITPIDMEYFNKHGGQLVARSEREMDTINGVKHVTANRMELSPVTLQSGFRLENDVMHELQHVLLDNIEMSPNPNLAKRRPRTVHLGLLHERFCDTFDNSTTMDAQVIKEGMAEFKNQQALHLLGMEKPRMTYAWHSLLAIHFYALDEEATTRWRTGDITTREFYDRMEEALQKHGGIADARDRRILMNLAMQDRDPNNRSDCFYHPMKEVIWSWIETLDATVAPKGKRYALWNRADLPPNVLKVFRGFLPELQQ